MTTDWWGCIDDPGVARRFWEAVVDYAPHAGNAVRIETCEGHRTVGVFGGRPAMSADLQEKAQAEIGEIIPENN